MAGVRYAEPYGQHTGRSRRVSGPARFRPIGYRVGRGGPQPQPGPNPAAPPSAPAAPGPAPTPQPRPGPAPPAQTPSSGPGLDLGGAIARALASFAGMGQVLLGAALLGAGLLLLASETSTGGQLARTTRRAAVKAVQVAVTRKP